MINAITYQQYFWCHLVFAEYREIIKFTKPAPIDEQQNKKEKKQKEGGKKKAKGSQGGDGGKADENISKGVEDMKVNWDILRKKKLFFFWYKVILFREFWYFHIFLSLKTNYRQVQDRDHTKLVLHTEVKQYCVLT